MTTRKIREHGTGWTFTDEPGYASDGPVTAYFSVIAVFDPTSRDDCSEERAGDSCKVRHCPKSSTPGSRLVAAGEMTVEGARKLAIQPSDKNSYSAVGRERLFMPEQRVSVRFSGSEQVPAFGFEVQAPSEVDLSKSVNPRSRQVLRRGDPLSLQWDAKGDQGLVTAVLVTKDVKVECRWPAGDQRATIPAAAIEELHGEGAIFLGTVSTQTVQAGPWRVEVQADGADAPAGIIVQ